MITEIEAINYRCFEHLKIELKPFVILAGANGAGKTTMLDIPILFRDLFFTYNAPPAFFTSMDSREKRSSNISELMFRPEKKTFSLKMTVKLPETLTKDSGYLGLYTHITYELTFRQIEQQLVVDQESLYLNYPGATETKTRKIVDHRYENGMGEAEFTVEPTGKVLSASFLDPSMTVLPKVRYEPTEEFPAAHWFIDFLYLKVRFFAPRWSNLRVPVPPGRHQWLNESGKNIPWCALNLARTAPERYSMWIEHVQTALPQISDIQVIEREDDHHAYFRVFYEGGFSVTSTGLSEGTLRIMALTLLPYLPNLPSMLVIEEPENSIHPQAIEAVMQSLRSLYGSQVLVSTHSPIVLADAELSELVVARLQPDGSSMMVKGEAHPRLKEWKGGIDLGSLYATGVFE